MSVLVRHWLLYHKYYYLLYFDGKMYALNIKRGTTISHPEVDLPGLVAVSVSPELANQLKHIINVVIFDSVMGVNDKSRSEIISSIRTKSLYGIDKNTLEPIKVN